MPGVFDSVGLGRGMRICVLTSSWVMVMLLVWALLLEKQYSDYFLSKHNIISPVLLIGFLPPTQLKAPHGEGTLMTLFSGLSLVPRAVLGL